MKREFIFSLALLCLIFMAGCRTPQPPKIHTLDYSRPLPPGELALRKITDPAMIPDFAVACYNVANLRESVGHSLNYLSKPSSRRFFPYARVTHDHAVASLQEFADMLDSGLMGRELARAIRSKFDVYISVGCDNRGTVLFTGYYTPIFDGSLEPGGAYRYPLYKQPDDLVKDEDGVILGRKGPGGMYTQYPSRAELETSGELIGTELLWLTDPFEVYVAHVQGSAKIRLPDGQLITTGYAASNGHAYINIIGTMNILVCCQKHNVKKLVFSSTSAVYDEQITEFRETTARKPSSPYGLSKATAERYIEMLSGNMDYTILRYANVYGPRQLPLGENQLVPRAIRHILYKDSFEMYGDGSQTRDFIYIKDVALATVLCATNKINGILNVATGKSTMVKNVLKHIKTVAKWSEGVWWPGEDRDDRQAISMNNYKLKTIIPYLKFTELREGIANTYEWWLNEQK